MNGYSFSSNTLDFYTALHKRVRFLLFNSGANMKTLKFTYFVGLLLGYSFLATTAVACHKGGAMGVASEDPLNSTLDYTSGSTFVFASTAGTLGCKNWDFVKDNRVQYLDLVWNTLSEEAAQGKGEHIFALSGMYGCQGEYKQTFESLLYGNYQHLFSEMNDIENYERAHLLENEINRLIQVNRMEDQCTYTSSS